VPQLRQFRPQALDEAEMVIVPESVEADIGLRAGSVQQRADVLTPVGHGYGQGDGADCRDGVVEGARVRAVGQLRGDDVAASDAEVAQQVGQPVGPRQELAVARGGFVVDHSDLIGSRFSLPAERGVQVEVVVEPSRRPVQSGCRGDPVDYGHQGCFR
jgi:hypothetical protein